MVVLNNATAETDNPDLRDRAYTYWRLLSTDSEASKDVVLAEKPVIGDDFNQLDPSLLDELLANIATLSSVYHKPPEAFVTRVKTVQRMEEEEEFSNASECGNSESPAYTANSAGGGVSPPTTSKTQYATGRQPAAVPSPVPDLLDPTGMDNNNNAIVPVDDPITTARPPLPVLFAGQGLQISAQLVRKDGQIYYSMLFENNSQVPLDGFMIQFNKKTFGLAAAGPLQLPVLQPGTSASTLLPMVMF